MTLYQLHTVDTSKLEAFLNEPIDRELEAFAANLRGNDQANDWFAEEPPAWKSKPESWVRQRLSMGDWYADLNEPEMLAWDHAIQLKLESAELESNAVFTPLPVDGIPTLLFDLAAEAADQAGENSWFLQMRPLRFHKLPAEIEEREPYERIYWPEHAVVLPTDAAKMVDAFGHYDKLIQGLAPRTPQLARQLETEGADAAADIPHLMVFLDELVASNATWYARLDC